LHVIKQIKHHFFTREFILFLFIGCINTFNASFLAWLLSFGIPNANFSFILGYLASLSFAYYMNCKIVFKQSCNRNQYIKFAISYIPNFIIENIIVVIFYNILAYPPIVSYIIAAIIGIPATFLMVKLFAFGRK